MVEYDALESVNNVLQTCDVHHCHIQETIVCEIQYMHHRNDLKCKIRLQYIF